VIRVVLGDSRHPSAPVQRPGGRPLLPSPGLQVHRTRYRETVGPAAGPAVDARIGGFGLLATPDRVLMCEPYPFPRYRLLPRALRTAGSSRPGFFLYPALGPSRTGATALRVTPSRSGPGPFVLRVGSISHRFRCRTDPRPAESRGAPAAPGRAPAGCPAGGAVFRETFPWHPGNRLVVHSRRTPPLQYSAAGQGYAGVRLELGRAHPAAAHPRYAHPSSWAMGREPGSCQGMAPAWGSVRAACPCVLGPTGVCGCVSGRSGARL
jgi:hypothetical protein